MLKKIGGFSQTAEAAKVTAAIEQRAQGALRFSVAPVVAATPTAPQAPSL